MSNARVAQEVQLVGMDISAMETLASMHDELPFRGKQLFHWVYKQQVDSINAMNTLPSSFRDLLTDEYVLHPLKLIKKTGSDLEQTQKFLLQLPYGEKIESVVMEEKKRVTLCVSTQVGCAVDCKFCATAKMGFIKNLTAGEIVDQYLLILNSINKRITNVVFMGMGEPFLNYQQVIKAANLLNHKEGINLSAKRITISTVGIIPKIIRYTQEGHKYKLAISLNGSSQDQRLKIMPISKTHSMDALIKSAWDYYHISKKLITLEYVLLSGVNDDIVDADRLMNLIGNLPCKLNLIPYNEIDGPFYRSSEEKIERFLNRLKRANFTVTIRWSKGTDISGGCGQLAVMDQESFN
ncbi:MAG: 23S rRNA (adenine(2503)-C(2))-methyltransferase RlmN [Candidatus Neomarinimicrobiota bacterium]